MLPAIAGVGATIGGPLTAASVESGDESVLTTIIGAARVLSVAAAPAIIGDDVMTGVLPGAPVLPNGSALVIADWGAVTVGEGAAANELAAGDVSDSAAGLTTEGSLTMTGTSTAGLINIPTIRGVNRIAISVRFCDFGYR